MNPFSESRLPSEMMLFLADRVRLMRKQQKISQQKLAILSGVSFGSIKRFEAIGEISLVSLLKIAQALNCMDDFQNLFVPRENPEKIKALFTESID